jgi:hypothetical protein
MDEQTGDSRELAELRAELAEQRRQIAALQGARRGQSIGAWWRGSRLWVRLALAAAMLLVASGTAVAAIPALGGTITACYGRNDGELRVIDAERGQTCRRNERTLTWGQAGQKGDKGDKGAQGTPGAKGDKGDTGAQGLQGAQGPQGTPGAKGDKGDKGDTGPQGAQGDPGPQGAQGPQGDKGDKGDTGAQGAQGAAGISGYEVVSDVSAFDSTPYKRWSVLCPAGKKAIGGGAEVFPSLADPNRDTAPVVLRASTPSSGGGEGWYASGAETAAYTYDWDLTVYVICANVAP